MKASELIDRNIIIAPFNAYGIITYERLKASGVKIRAFFDKNIKYHHARYENIPIYPWSYFHNTYIVIGHEQYNEEFIKFLNGIRYPKEYILKQSDIEFECSYDDACLLYTSKPLPQVSRLRLSPQNGYKKFPRIGNILPL